MRAFPDTLQPLRPSRVPRRRPSNDAAPFRRARPWLDQLLRAAQREVTTPPEVWCQLLLGCWICDSVSGTSRSGDSQTARAVGTALNRLNVPAGAPWSRTSPALKLITAALLAQHHVAVDYLHGDAGYVRQAQSILQGLAPRTADDAIAFHETRFLLHRLGRVPQPRPAGAAEVLRCARALPLTDTGAGLERFLGLILSATEFGTGARAFPPPAAWFSDMLLGFTIAPLRRYDLVAGSRWLRAAQYLGVGGEMFNACRAFLLLHQKAEGPFGFFSAEERTLVQRLPKTRSSLIVEAALSLPVTVECLWTLAEVSTGWRLYGTITPFDLPVWEERRSRR